MTAVLLTVPHNDWCRRRLMKGHDCLPLAPLALRNQISRFLEQTCAEKQSLTARMRAALSLAHVLALSMISCATFHESGDHLHSVPCIIVALPELRHDHLGIMYLEAASVANDDVNIQNWIRIRVMPG
jgi:hypothetical protein